jgi:uncharacterized phage protein (predicted DNA packaging)
VVTLESLKAHLNVTTDVDDALIGEKLAAAAEWVSKLTAISADATDIPAPVNEAVRQLAAHLYENREASLVGVTAQSLPFGMMDLLDPYRAWVF